jgi:hypothetical protein
VNRFSEMPIDIHQHLWPAPFVAALRARRTPPRLDGWTLHLPGERAYAIDPAQHEPERRAAQDDAELILLAPSAACGFDRLPADEAAELAAAWHEGALNLPAPFRAWAMAGTQEPDAAALQAALDAGAVGLELAADVLAGDLDRVAPLLEVLDAAGLPLLVHPGPAGAQDAPGRPAWWSPVVPYVAQLHAAWWAWADGGRARFPRLPVCFVALAGLGPLHGERQRARGGAGGPVDPLTFVETSSYGTMAVDAVIRVLGIDVVVHGSDRPYAEPPRLGFGAAAQHAIQSANPGRLLARLPQEVPA